ncbi:MAG: PEP-CTERM sorting domain-containing protein [Planctomycetes bacterium]|nr:PEP-CTERM sorting domain-containing protein [Planctomycetota bacterium]
MRNVVAFVMIFGLCLSVAAADRIEVTPSVIGQVQGLGGPANDDNLVYDQRATNGYYTAFATDDVYKGELYETTAGGAWTMNAFHIGVVVPAAGQFTFPIEFYDNNPGYYPSAGYFVGGYNVSANFPSAGGWTLQVDIAGLNFAGPDVWMCYDYAGTGTGVLHVDSPPTIGTNYFDNGWIELDGTGYHWWWYGGTPNADLYGALNMVPEPGTIALLALGGLALIRRR